MKHLEKYKDFEPSNLKVVSTDQYVSVYYRENNNMSVVEMSNMDDNEWMINRANVKSEKSKGLGSLLLKTAIDEVLKYNPISIFVTPGGYNTDTEKQFNFYKKNGFVEMKNVPELLYYSKLAQPKEFFDH